MDRHDDGSGTLFVAFLNACRGVIGPQIAIAYNEAR